eukprot:TRINITY_DN6927_c0_g1_i2.p1 TRINITY_DN6927_c0_g1~~TRINITY_DN6927_c0_g1_i2.p1  ORF type:complete len:1712 (+),score=350.83 TRINITY_DN6927_c0_g1_i2:139-5274(+)
MVSIPRRMLNALSPWSLFVLILLTASFVSLVFLSAAQVGEAEHDIQTVLSESLKAITERSGTDASVKIEGFLMWNFVISGTALLIAFWTRAVLHMAKRCRKVASNTDSEQGQPEEHVELETPSSLRSGRNAARSTPVLSVLSSMSAEERLLGPAVQQALEFQTLDELLEPSFDAVFHDTTEREPLSHAALKDFVKNLDFAAMGVGPGNRVACVLPSSAEAAVLLISCFAKCTVVPLNPSSTQAELVQDAKRAKADVMIALESFLEDKDHGKQLECAAEELEIGLYSLCPDEEVAGPFRLQYWCGPVREPLSPSRTQWNTPEDVGLVLFTSGTSGNKKLVPYKLRTLVVGAATIVASWELRPSDKVNNMMPLFHIGGIARNVLSPVLSGGSAILCGAFDPVLFWDIIARHNTSVTWYYAGPTMHQMLLEEFRRRNLDLYPFRFIANAAGGLLPSLALEMKGAYGCCVLPGYGMTECMPISAPPLTYQLDREGTSGRRVGPELAIFDQEGQSVQTGVVGNIVVRGAPTFEGYEGDEAATKEAFFAGGWFNTGDMGYLDADGYLFITGRSKEVINRGGEIISPFEVEEAIQSHPRVKSVVAFVVPHEVLQESIGVAVVMHDGARQLSLRTLRQWCKKSLTFAKWPEVLVTMPDIPKNHANKPLRAKMAERLGLVNFWGQQLADNLSEHHRTFFAQCPAKGAPLTEPLPGVRMLHLDVQALAMRLRDEVMGVADAAAIWDRESQRLCACVVPQAMDAATIASQLQAHWHDWEIPSTIVAVSAVPRLPQNEEQSKLGLPSGVDEPALLALLEADDPDYVAPGNDMEVRIQQIWQRELQRHRISVDADFFEIGGNSLMVAPLAMAMMEELDVPFTAADLFSMQTIRACAEHAVSQREISSGACPRNQTANTLYSAAKHMLQSPTLDRHSHRSNTSPFVLFVQSIPLLLVQPLRRALGWGLFLYLFVMFNQTFSRFCSLLLALVVSKFVQSIFFPFLGIAVKWMVIGRYREGYYPLFGNYYLRWCFVRATQSILGYGIFKNRRVLYWRLLGARIGNNVTISSTTKISEPDLLTIGDNCVLDGCTVRPFAMNPGGCMVLRPIVMGSKSVVCTKSVIAGGAKLATGTCIGPLSSSHEIRDAKEENRVVLPGAGPPLWLRVLCGYPLIFAQKFLAFTPVLMVIQCMANARAGWDIDTETNTIGAALNYFSAPQRIVFYLFLRVVLKICTPVLELSYALLVKRTIIGTFKATPAGQDPDISSWQRFRSWLLAQIIPDAHLCGVLPLLGRHYEAVSFLYRLLGVKVGKRVYWPGSGFRFAEPDLVEIGDYVVFGSRSQIFTTDANHNRRKVIIEAGANVSDRCVLLPGTIVKTGAVMGSGALSKADTVYEAGVYVGSRGGECVLLKKSKVPDEVKENTYARAFSSTDRAKIPYIVLPEIVHIVWSSFCITLSGAVQRLPVVLGLLFSAAAFGGDFEAHRVSDVAALITTFMILAYLCTLILVVIIDIGSKWLFMGRRVAGEYSWDKSSYCQRWQLYLAVAPVRHFASGGLDYLSLLQGSQFLVWYYRALGAKIGKNVCLYPNGADPMMTEPEMVTIGDGACIDDASLIAHLNTQGVFSIGPLKVADHAVMRTSSRLQQAATLAEESVLLEHTLILPAETVRQKEWKQGWPAPPGKIARLQPKKEASGLSAALMIRASSNLSKASRGLAKLDRQTSETPKSSWV